MRKLIANNLSSGAFFEFHQVFTLFFKIISSVFLRKRLKLENNNIALYKSEVF